MASSHWLQITAIPSFCANPSGFFYTKATGVKIAYVFLMGHIILTLIIQNSFCWQHRKAPFANCLNLSRSVQHIIFACCDTGVFLSDLFYLLFVNRHLRMDPHGHDQQL